jgi:hypothetical protein
MIYFVCTGVQGFFASYFIEILNIKESTAHITFIIVCLTSPASGAILAGYVITYLGGYDKPNSLAAATIAGVIVVASGAPIPFLNNFYIIVGCFWVIFFAGGFLLPSLLGIMLFNLPDEVKLEASSMAQMAYNLVGNGPGLVLYGYAQSLTGGKQSRWGMIVLMYSGVPVVIGLSLLTIRNMRNYKKVHKTQVIKD